MGMLLVRTSFAEQIIEKYSSWGSYGMDSDSLVFYKEEANQGKRVSFSYYTELTLKLLFMMEQYEQSGQRISLNWNLVSQTILKHMTGVSGRMEQAVRETVRQYGLGKSGSGTRFRFQEPGLAEKGLPPDGTAHSDGLAQMRTRLQEGFQTGLQVGLQTGMLEIANIFREEEMKKAGSGSVGRKRFISSVERGRLKLAVSRMRQQRLEVEHVRQFIQMMTGHETAVFTSEITQMIHDDNRAVKQMTEGLAEYIESHGAQSINWKEIMEEEHTAQMVYNVLHHILTKQSQRTLLSALHIQDLFRKYEEKIFRNAEKKNIENVFLKEEERRLWGTLETVIDAISIRPEKAKKAGRELAEILKMVPGVPSYQESEGQGSGNGMGTAVFQTDRENLLMILKENPREMRMLRESVNRGNPVFREQMKIWMKKQMAVLTKAETERPLFSRVESIISSRFTEPAKAKRAEKELFEILFHDLRFEERERIFLETQSRESEGHVQETETQQRQELFLLAEEVRKIQQEELKGNTPDIREFIMRLFTHEYAKRMLQERLERNEKERVLRLESWVNQYESENEQLDQVRRSLVYEVRSRLGNEAADRLEQYFSSRKQVTSQVLESQSAAHVEEQVRHMMDSYLSVIRGEDILTHLNPEGEVLLENQVREKVRMPGGGQVEESRRKMEGVMNLVRNDYIYAYSQNRFLQNLRHHFNEMALSRLEIVQIEQGQRNILSQDSIFQEKNLQNVRLSETGFPETRFPETRFPEKRQEEMLLPLLSGRQLYVKPVKTDEAQSSSLAAWEETKEQVLRRQSRQENELHETKNIVKQLNEKIEIQEKLVTELKQKASQSGRNPSVNINQLTNQVMKKMEQELRLEKMRRGLL